MFIFFPVIAGTLFGIVLGGPMIHFAQRIKLIDMPGSAAHKTHKNPTPLAGGLVIIISISSYFILSKYWLSRDVQVVLLGTITIFIFGIWDDKVGLSAWKKLLGQLLASLFLLTQGVQVHLVDALFRASIISWQIAQIANIIVSLIWLIGITNAVNMIDSMDGIVAGMGMIASACYLYAAYIADQQIILDWSGLLFGICAGLYYWNSVRGKMFLGDSGSQIIGFFLASLGILYNPAGSHPESSWFLPIMILGIPIFDTTLVVVSRIRRKQSLGTGRRDHTYHRLIAIGFSSKSAVLITLLASLVLSGLAFFSLFLSPDLAELVFIATLLFGLFTLIWFEKMPTLDNSCVVELPCETFSGSDEKNGQNMKPEMSKIQKDDETT